MGINCFGMTDIGKKRENNQDSFLIENIGENLLLLTVCDGMGGANGGSEASSLAVNTFTGFVKDNLKQNDKDTYLSTLALGLDKANKAVFNRSSEDKSLSGMGTTLVSAIFDGSDYYLIWVGDSRIYAASDARLFQLSHDHSFVQTLVDSGSITPLEAHTHPNRNIITKAVGIDKEIECDVSIVSKEKIDCLLLCSDGLSSYVAEDKIRQLLYSEKDAQKCCEKLIDAANDAGGNDNITVIVHKKANAI